jgi:anti-sigma B factor antagonist
VLAVDPSLRLTTLRLSENAYVCTLSGELDVSTADAAGAALDQIERDGARYVVIDLLGLTFLDSAGIGLLMASARRLRSGDGELRLVVDDPRVVRMLEITGISRQFRLDRTLSDAVTDLTTQVLSYD